MMKLFQVDKDMPKLVSDHFIESINGDTSGLESLNRSHFDTYSELVQNETMFLYNLVSIRMNDIMKFLTIITSIFVPITFFTSVYGMNFDNIPELHYPHAYEIFWAASIGLSVFLIWQFKKRKWL